jgi:hypothetical protein
MKTRTKIYGAVALTSMVAIYILLLASLLEILRIGAAAFSAILLSMLAIFIASMLMLLLSSVDRLDQISQ